MPPTTATPAHLAFAAVVRRLGLVSPEALAALDALAEVRAYETGAWLLRAGDHAAWTYFVHRGLTREYYIGEGGEEHTRAFVAEGELTGSLLDLLSGGPAVTWIQALEPTSVLAIRFAAFDALCDRFPEMHRVARRLAESVYVRKTRREHEMLALSAADRHTKWLDEHAALDARLSRRHVASYLGITAEHLSRLRRAART